MKDKLEDLLGRPISVESDVSLLIPLAFLLLKSVIASEAQILRKENE